jgi:hypothetical protein
MEELTTTLLIQPDIIVFGIRFGEPVTTLTGLLVALASFMAWWQLGKIASKNEVNVQLRLFFLLMALGTTIGGIVGHAFLYLFPYYWKLPGWTLSMLSITALERAAILYTKPLLRPFWTKFFLLGSKIELILFFGLVAYTQQFKWVEMQAGVGLLVVMGLLQIYMYHKTRDEGSLWLLGAIPVAALAVLPHILKFSPSVWFTHFDIGHLIMCIAVWVLWKGAEVIKGNLKAAEL